MNAISPKRVLQGEILGEDDLVSVVVAESPYSAATRKDWAPAGLTISEFIRFCDLDAGGRYVVHIDGEQVKEEFWHRVRPKPGTTVTIQSVLGEIFSGIAALIGAISSAAAAVSTFISGLGIFGTILTTALSIGFNLLLGALFGPPKQKQIDQKEPTRGYSVAASRNTLSPFEAVPVVLGRHRFAPPYAAKPFTSTEGLNTIVHMAFAVGYGPLQLEDFRVGETSLSTFIDTTTETFQGYPNEGDISFFGQQIVEESLSIDLNPDGTPNVRRTSDNVNYITLDFYWAQGLYFLQKDGDVKPIIQRIEIQVAVANSNNYSEFASFTIYGDRTRDARRMTAGGPVSLGQYDVRVRIQSEYGFDATAYSTQKDVDWVAIRSYRPGRAITFRKPLAKVGIRMKASGQLNGPLDTFNLVASSIFKNVFGNLSASSNPADILRIVLQGPANNRPIADAQYDVTTMQRWWGSCLNEGWTYNNVITDRRSVYDMAIEVCAAGRAVPLFRDGLWSVVWDEPNAAIAQVFTPRNSWGFEGKKEFPERPHAWRIRFVNAKRDWIDDERIVYDDGYSAANATLFQALQLPGITDPDLIWRHGRYHIADLRLRPEMYILNVAWENLLVTRGDRVRVAHDAFLVGLAHGRVTAVDPDTRSVKLDQFVTMTQGQPYSIRFRSEETVFTHHSVELAGGDVNVIRLEGIAPMPAVGDLFTFGLADRDSAIFRVHSIERQDEFTATLTLVDDAPGIALADNGAIPDFVSNITAPDDPFKSPPLDLRGQPQAYFEGERLIASVYLSWQTPRIGGTTKFNVEMKPFNDANATFRSVATVLAPEVSTTITNLPSGIFVFRVQAIFDDGTFSRWIQSEAISTVAILAAPPDVTNFRISTLGETSVLTWDLSPDASVSFYEVRFSAVSDEWNSSVTIVEQAMPGTQVPTMVGSYLIKAGRRNGNRSQRASVIQSNVGQLANINVVETVDEHATGWKGDLDGVVVANDRLRLSLRSVIATWEQLSTVVNLTEGDRGPDTIGLDVQGTYYFNRSVDLGQVFTSRISARIDAYGESVTELMSAWLRMSDVTTLDDITDEEWSVQIEFQATLDDPASADAAWTEWQRFIMGDVTARGLRFRLRLFGLAVGTGTDVYSTTTPVVQGLVVTIDMPDRVFGLQDIVVPVAGKRIDFVPPFRVTPAIATADQGMQAGDYSEITNKSRTGFNIRYRNGSGSPIQRTVDIVAKGYGSQT